MKKRANNNELILSLVSYNITVKRKKVYHKYKNKQTKDNRKKMNEIYLKILGIYVLIITIVGTIFNTLTIYICRKVKQNSLFTFYQFYNFFSTIGMYYWNLNYFVMAYGPYPDLFLTTWPCRIGTYIQFICLQMIGWNIVSETKNNPYISSLFNLSLHL